MWKTNADGVRFDCGAADWFGRVEVSDLDVPPGTKEVAFGTELRIVGQLSCLNFFLGSSTKQFPEVEVLRIGQYVSSLNIPNGMFPNVREVVSESTEFRRSSGSVLVKYGTLLNTFCKKPGEAIDLSGVETIGSHAFSGCQSTNIIHADKVKLAEDHAFDGYSGAEACGKPYLQVGSLLFWVSSGIEELVLDDGDQPVLVLCPLPPLKKLTSRNWKTFSVPSSRLCGENCSPETLEILDPRDPRIGTPDFFSGFLTHFCARKEFIVDTPVFRSVDGVLYTRDGKTLIRFPSGREGDFNIPDGVEAIGELAFEDSSIRSVSFPDSVKEIGSSAFYRCKQLREVHFGSGLPVLGGDGRSVFESCPELKEVRIPRTVKLIDNHVFEDCGLSRLTLEDGVVIVRGKAFYGCDSLAEVHLPGSLKQLENGAFSGAYEIYMDGNAVKGLTGSFVERTRRSKGACEKLIARLHYKGREYLVPKYLPMERFAYLDAKLMYTSGAPDEHLFLDEVDLLGDKKGVDEAYVQDLRLQIYQETGDFLYVEPLRPNAKKILTRYLENRNTESFLAFLRLGFAKKQLLSSLFKYAQEGGMAEEAACIMNEIGKLQGKKNGKTPSVSFRL